MVEEQRAGNVGSSSSGGSGGSSFEAGSAQASMGPGVGYCSHAPASRAPGLSLNHTRPTLSCSFGRAPSMHCQDNTASCSKIKTTKEVKHAKTQSNIN